MNGVLNNEPVAEIHCQRGSCHSCECCLHPFIHSFISCRMSSNHLRRNHGSSCHVCYNNNHSCLCTIFRHLMVTYLAVWKNTWKYLRLMVVVPGESRLAGCFAVFFLRMFQTRIFVIMEHTNCYCSCIYVGQHFSISDACTVAVL